MRIIGNTGRVALLACAMVATLASIAPRANAVELRWKFTPGQKLNYNMVQDMTMGTAGGPLGPQSVTMRQEMVMTWQVEGVDEKTGEAVIKQKFDQVKMKMTLPGLGGFEYDSKSEEPPMGPAAMLAPMYKVLTQSEFELTMTTRGEIKEVKIPEEVLKALKNSPGAASMGDMATPEGFKKMISQGALVLPEKEPKEGETWTTKVEVNNPMAGKQVIQTTYQYEGTREMDGVNFAVFKPKLEMTFEGTEQLQMKVAEQDSSGEILFNVDAGRLHSSKLEQDVSIDVTAGGQTMQQKIEQKIDVKVTPAEEADAEPSADSAESSGESEE
jgi:hypothetical protein